MKQKNETKNYKYVFIFNSRFDISGCFDSMIEVGTAVNQNLNIKKSTLAKLYSYQVVIFSCGECSSEYSWGKLGVGLATCLQCFWCCRRQWTTITAYHKICCTLIRYPIQIKKGLCYASQS